MRCQNIFRAKMAQPSLMAHTPMTHAVRQQNDPIICTTPHSAVGNSQTTNISYF